MLVYLSFLRVLKVRVLKVEKEEEGGMFDWGGFLYVVGV
jgi:hypothetical protein